MTDRERSALERQLLDGLEALVVPAPGREAESPETTLDLGQLYDVQLASRHTDLAARWLRSQGKGYYTIGSAGHESNAILAMTARPTDPALLHYRSGAFYLGRAGLEGITDILS